MRVLSLDGSTTKTGFALVVDGVPEACGLWKAPSKLKKQEQKIDFMAAQARSMIAFTQPDVVAIEECGPQRNAKTFRALVRVEAILSYEARCAGVDTLLVMVKAAREAAMGDGKMGKVTVYEKLKALYPQFAWPENDPDGEKGGNDMSDSLAQGLATPKLLDRR
jgi:Holliday junction resolvasome RuvABC endonuclease subunit